MKKVISILDPLVVQIDNTNANKSYGIEHHDGEKGFLARACCYDSGSFQWRSVNEITRGKIFLIEGGGFVNTLKKGLDHGEIYEFDTPQELMKWLAQ